MVQQTSYVAEGDIFPSRIVAAGTVEDYGVVQAAAGARPIGVCGSGTMEPPIPGITNNLHANAGRPVAVHSDGEQCEVVAGAAVTKGALVMPDANGKAIPATATNWFVGEALHAASAADEKLRIVVRFGQQN